MKKLFIFLCSFAVAHGATISLPGDGVTLVCNPSGTLSGLNVGAHSSDPSSLNNGDIWYNSTSNALKARINGVSVSLGAGGGSSLTSTYVGYGDGSNALTGEAALNYTAASDTLGVGNINLAGVNITAPNAIAALSIDVTKSVNTKSIAADSTFTFSATPASGTWFSLLLTEIGAAARTVTIPSSYSIARGASITSFTLAASSVVKLDWYYDGSVYRLFGDPTNIGQLTQDTTPASTDLMESWDGTEHRYSTVAQLVAAAGVGGSPTTTRGELIRRGASADEALTLGPFGATFTSDGTDPQWFSRRKWITIYDEEFTKGSNYYFSTFTNGFVNVAPPDTTADGVATINSINYTGVALAGVNQLTFGTGRVIFQARVRMTRLASGGDNTYKIGFGDTTDGSAYTDGVWFSYTDNVNSGNWVANCKAGATSGSTNMSVGPAANTWYWLTIDISADGNTANFYVNEANGVSVTTTDSIPDSTSEVCGIEFVGASTSASTNQLFIDHCSVIKLATSNR